MELFVTGLYIAEEDILQIHTRSRRSVGPAPDHLAGSARQNGSHRGELLSVAPSLDAEKDHLWVVFCLKIAELSRSDRV
jgi:hypothetical protein